MLPTETVEAFKRGEQAAFAALMRTYGHIVRATTRRFWRGVFDQEEAMQEIWLHIWRNRGAVDVNRLDELPGFISVTARNRCVDLIRKTKPTFSLDDGEAPSADESPDDVARQREVGAAAQAFASSLRPAWRRFFDLHFVEGRPYGEIAAMLGISKLRCKYMKSVIGSRARRDRALLAALARTEGGARAP